MGMDLEYAPAPGRPRLHRRIRSSLAKRIRETYRYDTALWRMAITGPWIICVLIFTAAILGIPTGLGAPADIILAAGTGTLFLALAANILALVLALTGLPVPRLFTGSILSAAGAVLLILYYAELEIEAAAAVAVLAALFGGFGGLVFGLLRGSGSFGTAARSCCRLIFDSTAHQEPRRSDARVGSVHGDGG